MANLFERLNSSLAQSVELGRW